MKGGKKKENKDYEMSEASKKENEKKTKRKIIKT